MNIVNQLYFNIKRSKKICNDTILNLRVFLSVFYVFSLHY